MLKRGLCVFSLGRDINSMSKSRATRFDEARGLLSTARETFEELKEELDNWLESMPENLRSGGKADLLEESIDKLETMASDIDSIEQEDVEFPTMYG